jgi:lipid II:glycine glycyltransferase (peptidoglycan interpeptide bridge formation enzyme)
VRTSDKTLYNFYPADSEAWLAYSPMVLLLEFVASWAKERGFEVFDLGIATDNGVRNEGLIRFKQNIGGIETLKYTLWG